MKLQIQDGRYLSWQPNPILHFYRSPPGAILLARQFYPKHRLSISDACPVLGLSRDGLYKRIRTGTINLKIRKDEFGRQWILLADLIAYLFPEIAVTMPSGMTEPLPTQGKRGRGRPPGSYNKPKAVPLHEDEGGAQ